MCVYATANHEAHSSLPVAVIVANPVPIDELSRANGSVGRVGVIGGGGRLVVVVRVDPRAVYFSPLITGSTETKK